MADSKLEPADAILKSAGQTAPDYAPYHFVRGWGEEKKGNRDAAREQFLLARKFDNGRHRAPPEIDQIIRELVSKNGAHLVDIEKLFFEKAQTTPGFDLFVDHVHPNIFGQRLIAEALERAIIELGMVKPGNYSRNFPDESELQKALGLDDHFMDDVKFRLAIYYLLQRRLPDRDLQTRNYLGEITARNPTNVLAQFCLAAILLEDSLENEAAGVMEQALKQSGKEQVQKALDHYFFPKVALQGNYLLLHLNLDPALPPLRGIMMVRPEPEQTKAKAMMPLDQYQWIFRYDPAAGKVTDVTASVAQLYASALNACSNNATSGIDVKDEFLEHPENFSAKESKLSSNNGDMLIKMSGRDPWFAVPIQLNTLVTRGVTIDISITPEDYKQKQGELALYWSEASPPVFSEDKKVLVPVATDGKTHSLQINLPENINWLSSSKVNFIRIDPLEYPGRATVSKFEFSVCRPQAQ